MPDFDLIEIEGDAAVLARQADTLDGDATVSQTLQAATAVHRAFHLEQQYVAANLCPRNGCGEASNVDVADLPAALAPLPDPTFSGRVGRTLAVAVSGMPYMLGPRRRTASAS